jgi:hypothetical protein
MSSFDEEATIQTVPRSAAGQRSPGFLTWVPCATATSSLLLIAYLMDRRNGAGKDMTDLDRKEAERIVRGNEARGEACPPGRGRTAVN